MSASVRRGACAGLALAGVWGIASLAFYAVGWVLGDEPFEVASFIAGALAGYVGTTYGEAAARAVTGR